MDTYETFSVSKSVRVRFVFDPFYETRGSYCYETEAETKAAEDYEIEKLESGFWVALGCVIETKCGECGKYDDTDSIWGVVIEPTERAMADFASDHFGVSIENH